MGKRPKMLAAVIRDCIAPVLRECPTKCGMVSISEVIVTSEFSYATVFISALDHEEDALQFLNRQTKRLQSSLGQLYRKRIPELRFRIDGRGNTGARMDELLR
ncbi:MAG: ribosome-binding factor A [bacterium]|nr:ribosome-binding factor A [bacterium]